MRILELGKFYPPPHGGVETLLRSLCAGFVRRGDSVDCVVANAGWRTSHEVRDGARIHRYGSFGTLFSMSLCPAYPASTRKYAADIWQTHFPNPLADLAVLCGNRKTPLVISYHSDIVKQAAFMGVYRHIQDRLFRRADRIVVATPKHFKHSRWLQPYAHKYRVIPYGLNFSRLSRTSELERRVAALKAGGNGKPIVLNIGRLVPYKGQRHLIEAARDVPATFWLVGTGPLEPDLKRRAAELGVGDRVRFWGGVSDDELPVFLHACDVFCFPSITPNEAFGLVQVEAMSCGKAVVSCDLKSGVPYVNQNGVTGLIVPPADTPALVHALNRLIEDPELCNRMGRAGRKRAVQEFEEQVMLDRYRECFLELLEEKAPR